MNSDLFIPPPGIRTRILGTYARRALYSNKRDAKALSHVDLTTPYDDQYWYIRPGKDQYAGQYLIVSAFTDQCLYINTRDYAWRRATAAAGRIRRACTWAICETHLFIHCN